MPRSPHELAHRPGLDHAAGLEHDDPVAQRRGHREVVRDEEERLAGCVQAAADHVDHARLRHDVERGRRLVGQQELGAAEERQREADALALAARELGGEGGERASRILDAHLGEERDHLAPGVAAGEEPAVRAGSAG
ncbi:hypothetical protein CMMCAS04_02785 [Clavibacter michiganensis subsp. michiganensis]|nr:hypothetical protein CMMCAS04_02785 [Clavibacter michiganensis subsp. michiganensis]